MLKLRIDQRDMGLPWTWEKGRWSAGTSWIAPFDHPSLEATAITSSSSTLLTVRERCPGQLPALPVPHPGRTAAADVACPPERPRDFCTVELRSAGKVAITAGTFGTAPLFVTQRAGLLSASWDLRDLAPLSPVLCEREVARLLTLRLRYSSETVFSDVLRLTERAIIETDFTGPLMSRYPLPALHSRPRSLASGADVINGYENLLAEVVSSHLFQPGHTAVELSGGLDSANVALTLGAAPQGRRVTPAAMILEEARRQQQLHRRAHLIERAGFLPADVRVCAASMAPFHPRGERGRGLAVSPYDEPYHEAMTSLHGALAELGIRHVFTGIGGDEMVALNRTELTALPVGSDRPFMPWIAARTREAAEQADEGIAPATVINEMTLLSIGCAAPIVLGVGSWPVHPLADPALIRFGEWLPEDWRRSKRLHRERLVRRGLPNEVVHPPIPERFTGIMDMGLRAHGVPLLRRMLRTGSVLVDAGYVDPDELRRACDRVERGSCYPRDLELSDVLSLELAVVAFTGDQPFVG